jgi:hypothetical protein
MSRINTALLAFNRGVISPLALARIDLDRLQLAAETQTNWMPRVLGSMMLRPGMEYIYTLTGASVHIPFIASSTDTAIIELSDYAMRVSVDEELITRPAVTAAITNGAFTSNITSWTSTDEAGATSSWAAAGYLSLLGSGLTQAGRYQQVTVNEANVVHALRVVIARGPVAIKVGTSAGNDSYVSATLKTGTHSLAFTPTGNFYVEFSSLLDYSVLVDSVSVESSGILSIPSPFAEEDLRLIRRTQSADVVYLACDGYQQYRIERRDNDSWSIVLEEPLDGPFGGINIGPISITPSGLTGDITLAASKPLFYGLTDEHSGTLFKLVSSGQIVQASVTAQDTFTNSILVTGISPSRAFTYSIAGSWVATVTLQRSTDDATWVDVSTFVANDSASFDDGLSNVEYYYRIGVKTGGFTSGTVQLGLSFSGGNLTGIVKIRTVVSSTSATATVISPLGGTSATRDWFKGEFDIDQGFPTAVTLYEGRMWYAGRGKIFGSVSDQYSSFDDEVIGDSTTINRNAGEGPVDVINWLAPLQRLLIGTAGSEISVRSTSFDEPITTTNFNLKDVSTKGSDGVDVLKDGKRGLFVQRSGTSIYQLEFNVEDYDVSNLSELAPEICEPSIVKLMIQQEPDTRVHALRSDGKVALLVKDSGENTLAWVLIETDGLIDDVFVLPGIAEDKVYYSVNRGGNYYLERWALESEGRGGTNNKLVDCFTYETGVSLSTITGLSRFEGQEVTLWGNGKDLGIYTVSSGSITPSETVTSYCVGLPYEATFKSSKLAYAASMGTALNQTKKVVQMGIVARDIHKNGITYGPSETEQYDLPAFKNQELIEDDTIHTEFDEETFPFGGHWSADSRVVIKAASPRPATLLALVLSVQTNDKA